MGREGGRGTSQNHRYAEGRSGETDYLSSRWVKTQTIEHQSAIGKQQPAKGQMAIDK
jgi:hypothetical protein